jgi:hypothetical protein
MHTVLIIAKIVTIALMLAALKTDRDDAYFGSAWALFVIWFWIGVAYSGVWIAGMLT